MTVDVQSLVDGLISRAANLGVFDQVNAHEPMNPPGNGITCSVWVQGFSPVAISGLSSTSIRVLFNVRAYTKGLQQPYDYIDPSVTQAMCVFVQGLTNGFSLGGTVYDIDLLGEFGVPLAGQAGYVTIASTIYRVITVSVPVIVDEAFDQSP